MATPVGVLSWLSSHIEGVSLAIQAAATIGLVFFAGVQLRAQSRADKNARRAAYAALYGEYWHLYALADWWKKNDLVQAAKLGFLDPAMFRARDRAMTLRTLGEVSSGAAAFGGWAYGHLMLAEEKARVMTEAAPKGASDKDLESLASSCRKQLDQAAKAFFDGLRTAPPELQRHLITVVDPESELGKHFESILVAERFGHIRRHEPRLGAVGKSFGRRLAVLAAWFDPTSVISGTKPELPPKGPTRPKP